MNAKNPFSRSVPRRILVAVCAIAALVVGAFSALGASKPRTAPPRSQKTPAEASRSRARSAETADGASRYGLLRRAPSTGDGLGRYARGGLADPNFVPSGGVDPQQAHLASTPAAGWKVWVGDDSKHVCLFFLPPGALGAGVSCAPSAELADGDVQLTQTGAGTDPTVTIVGLVPDGVDGVTVHDGTGRKQVQVHDNVFVAVTDKHVTSYGYAAPDGDHQVVVHSG